MTATIKVEGDQFFNLVSVTTPSEKVDNSPKIVEEVEVDNVPVEVKGPIPVPLDNKSSTSNPNGFWSDFSIM